MAGRFRSFIEDLNEQERKAAEERAIEIANRQKIASEFDMRWQAVLRELREMVEGCYMKGSPFEWAEDADGINVANVGLHWVRTEKDGVPAIELELGSPVGVKSIIIDQKKSLPSELHMLYPVVYEQEFRWQLGTRQKGPSGTRLEAKDVADEIAMLLAQYADEYEKLKVKFDPFTDISI